MKKIKLTASAFDKGAARGGGYIYEIKENGSEYTLLGWDMSQPTRIITPNGTIAGVGYLEDKILDPKIPMETILEEINSLPRVDLPKNASVFYKTSSHGMITSMDLEHLNLDIAEELQEYKAYNSRFDTVVTVREVRVKNFWNHYNNEVKEAIKILSGKYPDKKIEFIEEKDTQSHDERHYIFVDGVSAMMLAAKIGGKTAHPRWLGLSHYTADRIIKEVEEELNDPQSGYHRRLKYEG